MSARFALAGGHVECEVIAPGHGGSIHAEWIEESPPQLLASLETQGLFDYQLCEVVPRAGVAARADV